MTVARFAVALGLCLAGMAASADEAAVYMWVDPSGQAHYSDVPPSGTDTAVLPMRYRRTDREALAEQTREQAGLEEAAKIREDQAAADTAEAESQRAADLRERAENCAIAKDRLNRYLSARRLYKPLPSGERQYLTDDELDAERAAAKRSVDEWCGG